MGAFIAGTELNSGNSMEKLIIYCQLDGPTVRMELFMALPR